jgi:hypothetical protein
VVVGVVGVAGYQTEKLLGGRWRSECISGGTHGPDQLSNRHACALAAATPAGDDALELTLGRLDQAGFRDEHQLRQILALAEQVGGCRAAPAAAVRRAPVRGCAAEACGSAPEHLALLSLGKLEEAARLFVRPRPTRSRCLVGRHDRRRPLARRGRGGTGAARSIARPSEPTPSAAPCSPRSTTLPRRAARGPTAATPARSGARSTMASTASCW